MTWWNVYVLYPEQLRKYQRRVIGVEWSMSRPLVQADVRAINDLDRVNGVMLMGRQVDFNQSLVGDVIELHGVTALLLRGHSSGRLCFDFSGARKLQWVDLAGNYDFAASGIDEIPRLEHLDLSPTDFSDDDIEWLARVKASEVDLRLTWVTEVGVTKLQRLRPDIRVIWP